MKLKKQNPLPLIKLLRQNILLFFAGFLLSVSSCTHHEKVKNIFHYNEQSGIATLDPAFAKNQSIMWAIHQLYNT
jgi:peptide/nickel transport system substrate-binding protein